MMLSGQHSMIVNEHDDGSASLSHNQLRHMRTLSSAVPPPRDSLTVDTASESDITSHRPSDARMTALSCCLQSYSSMSAVNQLHLGQHRHQPATPTLTHNDPKAATL